MSSRTLKRNISGIKEKLGKKKRSFLQCETGGDFYGAHGNAIGFHV
jgi:hypothetical protein